MLCLTRLLGNFYAETLCTLHSVHVLYIHVAKSLGLEVPLQCMFHFLLCAAFLPSFYFTIFLFMFTHQYHRYPHRQTSHVRSSI